MAQVNSRFLNAASNFQKNWKLEANSIKRSRDMNIIVPLGGVGKRFADYGFQQPKPLVRILGRPMLFHLLDGLQLQSNVCTICVYVYIFLSFYLICHPINHS